MVTIQLQNDYGFVTFQAYKQKLLLLAGHHQSEVLFRMLYSLGSYPA